MFQSLKVHFIDWMMVVGVFLNFGCSFLFPLLVLHCTFFLFYFVVVYSFCEIVASEDKRFSI